MAAISYLLQQWFSKKDNLLPVPTGDNVWGHFCLPQLGAGYCCLYWGERLGMLFNILQFSKKNYLAPNVTNVWDWEASMSRIPVVFSLYKNAYVVCMHMHTSMYAHVRARMHMQCVHACMWRPGVDGGCLPGLIFTLRWGKVSHWIWSCFSWSGQTVCLGVSCLYLPFVC